MNYQKLLAAENLEILMFCLFCFFHQQILTDFVSVEMVFHAKAIEFYSQCFENLAMIDEEMDLEVSSWNLSWKYRICSI